MKTSAEINLIKWLYWLILVWNCLMVIPVFAQTTLLETKITVHSTDKTLADVLDEIKLEYQIPFSYFKNQLPLQRKISIRLQNEPLHKLLDHICLQAGIQYQAIGGQIVLKEIVENPSKKPVRKTVLKPKKHNTSISSKSSIQSNSYIFLADNSAYSTSSPLSTEAYLANKMGLPKNIAQSQIDNEPSLLATSANTDTHPLPGNKRFALIAHLNPFYTSTIGLDTITLNIISAENFPAIPATKPEFRNSTLQLAFVPGISTHGIHPGEFTNTLSINLLAGYSAGNQLVEIGGLSNFNQNYVYGVQIGGLVNVVGGNKFVGLTAQEKQKLKKENTESNLQGFQVAGLTNIIAGNVFGWQTTGGINIVQKSLQGVQVAGMSNLVKTYTFGLQLAGISNASMESVDGLQIAGLYNYTDGELHGIQLSAFNQAGEIEGKRSLISVNHTGLQIGLVNTARRMNGFQVGLVNIGGEMAGTQIGLINLNSGKHGKGVPIGLFNLNTRNEFVRLYTSELFASNLEISTGSLKIQNMVSVGYNPLSGKEFYQPKWSIGYGIGQIKWPAKSFFYSYDAGIAHVNQTGKFTKQLSLLTRLRATAGYKITLRKVVFNVFGGVTFNTFIADYDRPPLSPEFLRIYHTNNGRSHLEIWPGFVAGIHL